ncbi:MAG: hypothetical protein LBJ23_02755 [Tannerella sp.]|nr:hypothetical protein [Tannerella sp.]
MKKKNKGETVAPPAPSSVYEYEEAPPIPPAPPKAGKKTPPAVPGRAKRTGGYESLFRNEGQRVTGSAPSLLEEETGEVSSAEALELNDTEDFRKAVIYSEILNRKY